MRRDDVIRLRHMLDAAREALGFAKGRTRADLNADRMLALALTRELEIIGEAASNVTAEGRSDCPNIPWPQIASMRNRLIHAYFDINFDTVWDTIVKDLPPLVAELEKAIRLADTGA